MTTEKTLFNIPARQAALALLGQSHGAAVFAQAAKPFADNCQNAAARPQLEAYAGQLLDELTAIKTQFGVKIPESAADRRKLGTQAINRVTGKQNVSLSITYATKSKPTTFRWARASEHGKAQEVWTKTEQFKQSAAGKRAAKEAARARPARAETLLKEKAKDRVKAINMAEPESTPAVEKISEADQIARILAAAESLSPEGLAELSAGIADIMRRKPATPPKPAKRTRRTKGANRAATSH